MNTQRALLLLAALPLLACTHPSSFVVSDALSELASSSSVRLLLLGDTGQLPEESDPHKISAAQRAQLRQSLVSEDADLILDLGDLFYEVGPKCGRQDTPGESAALLDGHLYDHVGGLDMPVLLVLGNHDVGPLSEGLRRILFGGRAGKRSAARERCYELYDQQDNEMHFPAPFYGVDIGPARIAALHTAAPRRQWPGAQIQDFYEQEPDDWRLMAGHHVLHTACDKVNEDVVQPFLQASGLHPDLYLNGHAHFLQMGEFDGVPAMTSGAGSKLREFPECTPTDRDGVLWGQSSYGYAVLDITQESMRVQFKDLAGEELYCWERRRDGSGAAQPGGPCQ